MTQYFYPTAQTIIDASMGAIRSIDPEDVAAPTATQTANALQCLNFIVTSWQAIGFQVWCTKNATLTLVAAQNAYKLGPSGADLTIARPLSISQAWLHNISANTDPIPMRIIGREEYNIFTSKASTATLNSIWYDPTYDEPATNSGANAYGMLHTYPTPDATVASTYNLQFVYTRPIQDFNAAADGLDFPQEWFNALKWNLAADMAYDYGLPVLYIDRIQAKADKALDMVQGWDRESGSSFIQPDFTGNR